MMTKKRIAAALLCTALALGTTAALPAAAIQPGSSVTACSAPTASGTKVTVTAERLNIRESPDSSSNETGALRQGATVEIVQTKKDSRGNRWGKLASGKGWINLKYTSTGGSGVSGNTETVDTTQVSSSRKYAVKTDCALNLRSGPGTKYDIVDTLRKGSVVYVVEGRKDSRGNTWGKLESGKGWLNLKYVSATGETAQTNQPAQESQNSGTAVSYQVKVRCDLNVRSGAGTGNGVVDSLREGAVVSIVQEAKDSRGSTWGKLASGKGWINLKYADKTSAQTAAETDSGNQGSGTAVSYQVKTTCDLNVRSGAGTGNSIVDDLRKGTVVTIVQEKRDSKGNTWGQLSGAKGWISLKYTSKTTAQTTQTTETTQSADTGSGQSSTGSYQVTVNCDLNIRSKADSASAVVGTVSEGETLTIVEEVSYSGRAVWGKLSDGRGWIGLRFTTKR